MKNKNNIRALTGMSQENLALLLQVSRSQIAMFESGKRNLPIQAMEKLALLLTLSQKESPRSRANPFAWHLINKKAFTIFDKKKK